MRIKYIVSGVAVAFVVSVGSASAADQFATLKGVTVETMNATELDTVRGMLVNLSALSPPVPFAAVVLVSDNNGVTAGIPIEVFPPAPPTP